MKSVLPIVLGQDDCFEAGRAHFLYAKSVAAIQELDSNKKKMNFHIALQHLENAAKEFYAMQSFHRVKDVYYMQVRS